MSDNNRPNEREELLAKEKEKEKSKEEELHLPGALKGDVL